MDYKKKETRINKEKSLRRGNFRSHVAFRWIPICWKKWNSKEKSLFEEQSWKLFENITFENIDLLVIGAETNRTPRASFTFRKCGETRAQK